MKQDEVNAIERFLLSVFPYPVAFILTLLIRVTLYVGIAIGVYWVCYIVGVMLYDFAGEPIINLMERIFFVPLAGALVCYGFTIIVVIVHKIGKSAFEDFKERNPPRKGK